MISHRRAFIPPLLATWRVEVRLVGDDGEWRFAIATLDELAVGVAGAVDGRQIASITLTPLPRPQIPLTRDRLSFDAWNPGHESP